jgi:membrane-associated phospholipid phosphatase
MTKSEAAERITHPARTRSRHPSLDEPSLGMREKVLVSFGMLASFAVMFLLLDRVIAQLGGVSVRGINPETAIDASIPFVPQFVLPYLLYYPWVMLPVPILRSRAEFYHAVSAFLVAQLVAMTIFMIFPSHMTRPAVVGDGLTHEMVRTLYRLDNGFNLIPSLHVAHSVLVALFFRALRPKLFPAVAAGTLLISVSTVLIKQHYFLDIPAGMALAIVSYYASVPIYLRLRNPALDDRDAAFTR